MSGRTNEGSIDRTSDRSFVRSSDRTSERIHSNLCTSLGKELPPTYVVGEGERFSEHCVPIDFHKNVSLPRKERCSTLK